MSVAIAVAVLASFCFGAGLITARVGLRDLDPRTGAGISVPTATLLFVLAAPFALDLHGFDARAVALFAVVGLFFPAVVTLLTFRSNELLGPTVTSSVAATSPLFALLAAALFLDERIPAEATASAIGVVLGVGLLSWKKEGVGRRFAGRALLWPICGAVVRGLAQAGAKAGLLLWANPFAASLISYVCSSATVIGADRLRSSGRRRATPAAIAWFAATGALNGGAVLLMYWALTRAPVWTVAPIVAAYPLITAVLGALFLHEEKLSWRVLAGAGITVAAIAYLVGAHATR